LRRQYRKRPNARRRTAASPIAMPAIAPVAKPEVAAAGVVVAELVVVAVVALVGADDEGPVDDDGDDAVEVPFPGPLGPKFLYASQSALGAARGHSCA
jgi:hypothetical protein